MSYFSCHLHSPIYLRILYHFEVSKNMSERTARSKTQKSRHRILFIPKERKNIDKIQEKEKRIRKSVIQGKDISSSHVRCTQREVFYLFFT